MSDFKLIFVHGYTATPQADWYPAISKLLDELGVDYAIPELPGDTRPHSQEWLDIVDREVKAAHKPVVLIGHSLGTRTVLQYLGKYEVPVKAVFLVAAFANRIENAKRWDGEAYPDFFEHKLDIGHIKTLCDTFVVIHSRDDRGLDFEQGEEIAHDLGAELVALDGRGHMSEAENAPYVLRELRRVLHF
jgi:uncharacterized protein